MPIVVLRFLPEACRKFASKLHKMPFFLALILCALTLPHAAALELHRGVAVHEWLNWSPIDDEGEYVWPPYRSEAAWLGAYRPVGDWPQGDVFAGIKAMGFDFVRLTVDPGPLVASDGARRAQALQIIAAALDRITSAGLAVVLDLHAVSQVPRYGMDFIMSGAESAGVAAYEEMVADVARMIVRGGTSQVALEPFNEPAYYPCDTGGAGDWQKIMASTVARIRAVSPELTVIVTGGCGGNVSGLVDLDPSFDDGRLYYSFHMYEPHAFTHQGLAGEDDFVSGLPWPAASGSPEAVVRHLLARMTAAGLDAGQQAQRLDAELGEIHAYFAADWGQKQLASRFEEALRWAEAHDIPPGRLFVGEFNAALMSPDGRRGAFAADRSRYVEAVRREAESHGIPWSIWEFSNPFGMSVIEPGGPAAPDRALLSALGLGEPQ